MRACVACTRVCCACFFSFFLPLRRVLKRTSPSAGQEIGSELAFPSLESGSLSQSGSLKWLQVQGRMFAFGGAATSSPLSSRETEHDKRQFNVLRVAAAIPCFFSRNEFSCPCLCCVLPTALSETFIFRRKEEKKEDAISAPKKPFAALSLSRSFGGGVGGNNMNLSIITSQALLSRRGLVFVGRERSSDRIGVSLRCDGMG